MIDPLFDNKTAMQRFLEFTPQQRLLIVGYVAPNGEELTEASVRVFVDLFDMGFISFGAVNTANEHLHLKHPQGDSACWCTACANVTAPDQTTVAA